MYGKHFASLYEGSMVGAGSVVFAVWGYVIAKQEPDRQVGSQVRLNPKLLATILGDSEEAVIGAIEYLCSPDPISTTKKEEGKRLIKIGEFDYQVVNGAKYRAIRDEDARRVQVREAQRRFREKQKKGQIVNGPASVAEAQYCEAFDPSKEGLVESGGVEGSISRVETGAEPATGNNGSV